MAKFSYDYLVSNHEKGDIFDKKGIKFEYVLKIPASYLNLPSEITRILKGHKTRVEDGFVETFATLGGFIDFGVENFHDLFYNKFGNSPKINECIQIIEENLARFGLKIKDSEFTSFDIRMSSLSNLSYYELIYINVYKIKNLGDLYNKLTNNSAIKQDLYPHSNESDVKMLLKRRCRELGVRFFKEGKQTKTISVRNSDTDSKKYNKYFPYLLKTLEMVFGKNVDDEKEDDGKRVYLIDKEIKSTEDKTEAKKEPKIKDLINNPKNKNVKVANTKELSINPSEKLLNSSIREAMECSIEELNISGVLSESILRRFKTANIDKIEDLSTFEGSLVSLIGSFKTFEKLTSQLALYGLYNRNKNKFSLVPDETFLAMPIEEKRKQPIEMLGFNGYGSQKMIKRLKDADVKIVGDFEEMTLERFRSIGFANATAIKISNLLKDIGLPITYKNHRKEVTNNTDSLHELYFSPTEELEDTKYIGIRLELPIESLGFGGDLGQKRLDDFKTAGIKIIKDINYKSVIESKIFKNDDEKYKFTSMLKRLGLEFLATGRLLFGVYGTKKFYESSNEERLTLPVESLGFYGVKTDEVISILNSCGVKVLGDFIKINRKYISGKGMRITDANKIFDFLTVNNIKVGYRDIFVDTDNGGIEIVSKSKFVVKLSPELKAMSKQEILEQPIESLNFIGSRAKKVLDILKRKDVKYIQDIFIYYKTKLFEFGISPYDLKKIEDAIKSLGIDLPFGCRTNGERKSFVNASIGDGAARVVPVRYKPTQREILMEKCPNETVADNLSITALFELLDKKGAVGLLELSKENFEESSEIKAQLVKVFTAYIYDLISKSLYGVTNRDEFENAKLKIKKEIKIAQEIFKTKHNVVLSKDFDGDIDKFVESIEPIKSVDVSEKPADVSETEITNCVNKYRNNWHNKSKKFHHSANGYVNVLNDRVKPTRMNYNSNENSLAEDFDIFDMQ